MRILAIQAVAASLLLSTSCHLLEPRSDPTRLFVLATIEELDPARPPAPRAEQSLGIGPLSIPEYLRTEIVSRKDVTGIVPSRYERWADPLDKNVERVLSGNLAFLTGARPVAYPWFAAEAPRTSVRVAIERFELEERARAVLTATWSLMDETGDVVRERRSRIVRELPGPDGATAVLELSRAIAQLSEEIAQAWTAATAR